MEFLAFGLKSSFSSPFLAMEWFHNQIKETIFLVSVSILVNWVRQIESSYCDLIQLHAPSVQAESWTGNTVDAVMLLNTEIFNFETWFLNQSFKSYANSSAASFFWVLDEP